MARSRTPRSARARRLWLAVVVATLCCAWTVPGIAGASPDAPVETPTPPVETPPAPEPSTPDQNVTRNVTLPTPERTGDRPVENGSREVQTAVGESAERLDDATAPAATPWPGFHLGLPDARTPSAATPVGPRADAPAAAIVSDPAAERSPAHSAASVTPRSSPGSCGPCGVALPAGVVLLGLAGGAGAAASFGLTPPQSILEPSSAAARRWVADRRPRLPPLLPGRFGGRADADPFAHPHRRALRDLVEAQPGVHLGGAVDDLALSRSAVRHHVRVLEDEGELETAKLLGRRRLFPPDADTALVAALADEGSRRVVQAVARVAPASVGEVVDETDRAYSTVSYHLDRLEAAGVVVREREGRRVSVVLADDVADVIAREGEVAAD